MSGKDEDNSPSEQEGLEDPLASLLSSEGANVVRLREAIAPREGTTSASRIDISGVRGSAAAALASTLAERSAKPVVLVCADADAARKAALDVEFYLDDRESDPEETGAGDVLIFAGNESSPYADVNPDRRGAMSRMATLAHVASKRRYRVLVVAAAALVRKVVPKRIVERYGERVRVETEIDREELITRLTSAGYLRVPVVEDPGSFAIRGALLDLWPASSEWPVRVELYGDLVVAIKEFDPFEQRTRKVAGEERSVAEVWLPPVREAIIDSETSSQAKACVQEMADAVDMPTLRARTLVDDVVSGRPFFGAEGFLPAYYGALDPLWAYLDRDVSVVLEDPPAITQAVRTELERAEADAAHKGQEVHFPVSAFYETEDDVVRHFEARTVFPLHRLAIAGEEEGAKLATYEAARNPVDIGALDHQDLARAIKNARGTRGKSATLLPLIRRITHWREHGLSVVIAARAQTQAERLVSLLRHQGIACTPAWIRLGESQTKLRLGESATPPSSALFSPADRETVRIVVGPLSRGAVFPADGLVFVTEEEIFGARVRRRERRAADTSRVFLEDLRSLKVGDYVVHVDHGIGRYQGLVHKDVGGLTVDLLVVEYGGGDKLYLPVHRLNQVQKYTGGDNAQPKLDRLGGATFSRTKSKVKKAVLQMADELLRLYAERQAQPGDVLPPRDDEYRAFEATFPFDETPDQAKAIDDVNSDLEIPRPMDRLVCGDVGFGKTEVAIRAAFRVAMTGKQVALLCPTTVLAAQHFRTFEGRMNDYALTIAAMSRFQSKKEQDETLKRLKEGKVDIVVGTHRLLSKDVHFKNLGLLIVDEEQRFGVGHKERIKQIRAQVDVLTLTATPIPRTLQMAIGGLRDLSLITTPPVDRRAVRTVVSRWDEQVVREAITRELSRGGQIFYVFNRIEGLYEKAERLKTLVPSARIAVAHGQMTRGSKDGDGGVLEDTMLDFVEGRYDILVSTAIVESGLDIPRANTMIIDRADLFGLAQLYQLRGRVGRSKERAYCYLIVPPANAMTDEARARIEALERHTELGSGFQIASLDLELRGAGDLLGGEQSGNLASVGFDLFCQMLQDAVQELRGEEVVHDVDTDLSFDVSALLPENYVGDVGVRLSLYKRLASAIDEAHVGDIANEMEDRFGPPPEEVSALIKLMTIKTELRKLKVLGCEANAKGVTLHLREDTPLDPRKITDLVRRPKSPFKLTPDMRLCRRFDGGDGLTNTETLLTELSSCLKE